MGSVGGSGRGVKLTVIVADRGLLLMIASSPQLPPAPMVRDCMLSWPSFTSTCASDQGVEWSGVGRGGAEWSGGEHRWAGATDRVTRASQVPSFTM